MDGFPAPDLPAPFAVFDVETTGLAANGADRVIEIAIVETDHRGTVLDEYCTLVHPERDPGPSWVHGISLEALLGAPRFEEVAGDIAGRLAGRTLVGHNVQFDLRFLAAEFARLGHALPRTPTVCTMRMSRLLGKAAPRKLASCCEWFGVDLTHAHSALGDARATAELLACGLARGLPLDEFIRTHDFGTVDIGHAWPELPLGGPVLSRD